MSEAKPPKLTLIQGQKDLLTTVCPWCGDKFIDKVQLDLHWDRNPRCKANRNASSPLQSRYEASDVAFAVPGQETLARVRSNEAETCTHPEEGRKLLYAEDVPVGWQCTYCYEVGAIE